MAATLSRVGWRRLFVLGYMSLEDSAGDGRARCGWSTPGQYDKYHDEEWGVPSQDDRHLFEMLILEAAQAGLSWLTVLKKREGYREAFAGFEIQKVAAFTEDDAQRLLQNPGIIRNRLKVASAINNAQRILEVQAEFGSLANYLWSFVGGEPIVNRWESLSAAPVTTDEAKRMSKELLKRGFRFVGPTVCYSFMQAVGMVNDHLASCYRHGECEALCHQFKLQV